MNSTALGATAKNEGKMIFIREAHEKLKEVRYQDVYHKALWQAIQIRYPKYTKDNLHAKF